MSPGIQWCHLFFCTWSRTPKKSRLIVWRTIRRHVVERNLAFGGQKSRYRFEILCCGGRWLDVYHIIRTFFFENFQNVGFYGHFYSFKNKKRCFWTFGGQNHEISKIWDSHLVEIVILRLTYVLYAFPLNSLPFMDSQTIALFGSEIAFSDVTKTLIASKFSVRCFWNFVHSICDSYPKFGAAAPRQTGVITRRKKWERLTPPPPSKSRVNFRPAGGVWTPPCGFSRIARKRPRAAPLGSHLPYPPSFWQLLWKFRSWVMQVQVSNSGRDHTLQKL